MAKATRTHLCEGNGVVGAQILLANATPLRSEISDISRWTYVLIIDFIAF